MLHKLHTVNRLGLGRTLDDKLLVIKYISYKEVLSEYVINIQIISKNLKSLNSKLKLYQYNYVLPSVEIKIQSETLCNSTKNIEFKVSKKLIDENEDYYLEVSCDNEKDETGKIYLKSKIDLIKEQLNPNKTCYCNRDFTIEELKNIVIQIRKKETSGIKQYLRDPKSHKLQKDGDFILDKKGNKIEIVLSMYDAPYGSQTTKLEDRIFFLGKDKIQESENNFQVFTEELNKAFKNYKVTTCIRKIHFLAQAYVETQMFTKTYETDPNIANISGGEFYRGRGFLQLTHNYNYKEFYKVFNGKIPSDSELVEFVPKVAKSMKLACQGSGWYWEKLKINIYADKDEILSVSAAINRPLAITDKTEIDNINGLTDRKKYYELLKTIMDYEKCKTKK